MKRIKGSLMFNLLGFVLVTILFIAGCATARTEETVKLRDIEITFTDRPHIHCGVATAIGCVMPPNRIICPLGRWEICGHELCHVIFRDEDHRRECKK